MAQEELNLVEFSSCKMTQSGTRAPKIVRRQLVDARASRRRPNDVPHDPGGHPIAPDPTDLVDRAEYASVRNCGRGRPAIDGHLHPGRDGNGPYVSAFAHQVGNDPVILALLNRLGVSESSSPRRSPQPISAASMA